MPSDAPIAAGGLTAAEAAARLGVKRQTLYAYVSRGLLSRTLADDGRTSRFDPAEIDRLLTDRRPSADGELRTVIATGLTRVADQGLLVRGHDLVQLVAGGATFTDVADLLWQAPPGEPWIPDPDHSPNPGHDPGPHPAPGPPRPAVDGLPLLDALRVIVAHRSAADPLRHDLSPRGVRAAGRSLILALCRQLPAPVPGHPPGSEQPEAGPAGLLWPRLTAQEPTPARLAALDTALALLADHGLASSTFAARIAASVRADPYSVVGAGLGVVAGPLHGAASGAVHELLADALDGGDTAAAVGATRRRLHHHPGFGHTVYTVQDPRYGALMARVVDAWGDDRRLVTVYRVRDLVSRRSDSLPNIDLALGALTFLADMAPDAGEAIFAIARTAGWLAHALEEYGEQPLRFRTRERYTGPLAP